MLIAVKALPAAKSRLLPATLDAASHRTLVEAMRTDTLTAALGTPVVARVVLIADSSEICDRWTIPAGVRVVVQHSAGLNGALRDGAQFAADRWPDDGIAALVGDLPALRADELGSALLAASELGNAFVADAAGTGTTMLTAAPGSELRPGFGPGSAARHARHATALDTAAGLRTDVDTAEDLAAATALGLGPNTADALAAAPRARRQGATSSSPTTGIVAP